MINRIPTSSKDTEFIFPSRGRYTVYRRLESILNKGLLEINSQVLDRLEEKQEEDYCLTPLEV